MKRGIVDRGTFAILLSNYITFPILGWYIGGIIAAVIGFLIAWLTDKYFPKSAYELTWDDIDNAIENQCRYGCNYSSICFRINKRKAYIYKDDKGNPARNPIRFAIIIPISLWKDIIEENDLLKYTEEYEGYWYCDRFKRQKCFFFFPLGGAGVCREILLDLLEESESSLNSDVSAKINCTNRDIWDRYE